MYKWSSPAMWSFGAGERVDDIKLQSNYHDPGPGAYPEAQQDTYMKKYPSWKVGKSQRQPLHGTSNPQVGPGKYDAEKKSTQTFESKTMPKADRGHSEHKGIPAVGPGSYEIRTAIGTAPNFSFGYKSDGFGTGDRSKTPGPGAYEIQNVIDIAVKNSQKNPEANKQAFLRTAPQNLTYPKDGDGKYTVPGPGTHYNPKAENYEFRYFQPAWKMGTASRDDIYNTDAIIAPGPGKYNIPEVLKTKSGFTILGKNQKQRDGNDVPAPNAYNQKADIIKKTVAAVSIGKAQRKDMANADDLIPGPGKYPRDSELSKKGTRIGTSQRTGLYSTKEAPGPGEYEISNTIGNTSKYSMGIKFQSKKAVDVMPGPGEYEPFATVYFEKTNGAVIGQSQRPGLYKKAMAPGPGQYDIRGNLGNTMAPKSKFGTARRAPIAKITDEPGPGYYNIPSAIGNIPRYQEPGYAKATKEGYDLSQHSGMSRHKISVRM